jgi:hypothetical protein
MITPSLLPTHAKATTHRDDKGCIREMTVYARCSDAFQLVIETWFNLACEPIVTRVRLSETGFLLLKLVMEQVDDLNQWPTKP